MKPTINGLVAADKEAEKIFRILLPQNGLTVREEQVALCHRMLLALFNNEIILCDAGVGIGKTHAYLTACILYEKYKNQNKRTPTIVISTSSVALQDAILGEYIPFLSRVFLENGVIPHPIRAVVRKGKERFVCDYNLLVRLNAVRDKVKNPIQKAALSALQRHYDMDKVAGLSGFDRKQVGVPKFCPKSCSLLYGCRYHRYLEQANAADMLFQICNHNYLLADAEHRLKDFTPLLHNYQVLVIDEAHKLTEAASQMYSKCVGEEEFAELCELLEQEHFTHTAQRLREVFRELMQAMYNGELFQNARTAFVLTAQRETALRKALHCLQQMESSLFCRLPRWVSNRLEETKETLSLFLAKDRQYVLYLQYDRQGTPSLCCSYRQLSEKLQAALWEQGTPVIQTSGTLMAGGSFQRTQQVLGLMENQRVKEFVVPSPFDYEKNCLLYIPVNESHSQMGSREEILLLSGRIHQLIDATHGHTLVLFTSYSLMGSVYNELKDKLAFPLLEVWRHSQEVIQQFKQLSNGVLFAAGSCWEGVDFPGDIVSSLIITRLPFPVPDPVSEAEREQYPTLQEYIRAVVIPDMQKKLRQGFGRAIRSETDTCVVSILDHRAAAGERYHRQVLEALPKCSMTDKLETVKRFIRENKSPDYFL